jgi:hypothetical protein
VVVGSNPAMAISVVFREFPTQLLLVMRQAENQPTWKGSEKKAFVVGQMTHWYRTQAASDGQVSLAESAICALLPFLIDQIVEVENNGLAVRSRCPCM